MTKIKPKLTDEEKRLLKLRNEMNRKRPWFRRQEWFRYKRLGDHWRRPKGKHSKMREHKGYRPPVVDSGYRGPRKVRGLHPSGFKEVLVHNVKDLEGINPEREAIRIASRVGVKKRTEIEKKAKELNIRVLNPMLRGE
ncbi:50S ribosomal protein L32e [Candidatus Aciduliprofundum boonei]|uniref:Large ribosomal subunit protein eL32 n=1 Tax=Aciduliprofundum boonei (strain DSM 19572 / T469) TaxID=439481 RepID=D3TB31_ACIB4|nr:50S ribosomal protein L32e [Candidatus Aciduliprofundum boonei]ADD09310.1 Ribosomal protein L32e [Aciduliprofundum boonei T469]HII55221.1 50S ribosomal protein L32e [Candidatus Aciduliprofundum boonei]